MLLSFVLSVVSKLNQAGMLLLPQHHHLIFPLHLLLSPPASHCPLFSLSPPTSRTHPQEVVQQAFAGLYALVRAALRIPPGQIKKNAFNEDLDTLNVPVELKAPITKLVFGPGYEKTSLETKSAGVPCHTCSHAFFLSPYSRAALQPALDSSIVQRSKLNSMQWRVDVSISTR